MPAAKTQKEKPVSSKKVSMSASKKTSPAKDKKAMSSKTKSAGPGRPAGVPATKKAKTLFSKEDSVQIYLFRCLKKVHPTIGISKTAMLTLNSLILDIYRKITRAAAHLSTSTKQLTLSANDIQSATKLCIPGEIGKLAVSEGSKAVTFYNRKN